ncbi:uncharacterized protein LOC135706646 [Ochlerotatus camptorhynchus]|uniref:uncharacterized protein LOC135706646 n=1 Tax=Ochlerotatus camptorhynchus TaxID=644619 RepID=UPI0031E2EEF2
MPRTRRKRKLSGKLNDCPEQDRCERETKIKTEPEDDLPASGVCCLCKASAGVQLSALFEEGSKRADPTTVDKIKICIGREMSPETDPAARICCLCLQELDAHHGFWKQALQCNDYAQNQMAADEAEVVDAPTEIRVCRFCLKIGGKLLDLFPEGAASNEHQLDKIRECLAVQMNSWDPVTKICRACIQRIQKFLDFQTKHVPVSIFQQENAASSSYPSNGMLQEETQSEGLGLELSVLGSNSSIEDENKRIDQLTGVKPKPEAIRPEIVELLGADSDARNFSVVLKNGEQLKVAFEGYQFRFHSTTGRGGTLWYCVESKLRRCCVQLEIDSKGEIASITSKRSRHVHPVLPPKIMECPIGKGFVQSSDNNEPFWLFNSRQMYNNQSRSLIFAGFRYFLHCCNNSNPISIWHCGRRGKGLCMAILEVGGIFQHVQIIGAHNHAALKQEIIDVVLKGSAIDLETTEAIDAFQKNNQVKAVKRTAGISKEQQRRAIKSVMKEKSPDIFQVLQEDDPERNFECVNAGSKLKIKTEGFEYRYYGTQEDESTLWKCIMDSLHHCLMMAKVSGNGKHLEIYKGSRHSHPVEPAEMFGYPLGKRMIGDEPLWMLKRFSIYYESRYVIYRDNVFILQEVNKKGVIRWKCLRKQSCHALLIVKGDFKDVCLRKDHSHEKTPQKIITRLIEGRSNPLSPAENISFKERLLSVPSMTGKIWDEVRNEHETFYVLNEVKTGDRVGYGLIFRGFRYSFTSQDQYGTSRWLCMKQEGCRVAAVVEGIYESIYIKEEHTHEVMLDSEMDLMIQRSANNTLSDAAEGSGLVEHLANDYDSNNILSILARQDPDRNFSVSRMKAKLLIHFDEEDFRINLRESDGTSLWSCTWLHVRKCPVVLHLSADGKQVTTVDPEKKHNHSEEQIALFYLACGKALVYDEYIGASRYYWLFSCQSEYRTNRAIIYQGYKYYLHTIGNNRMSSWKCRVKKCKAFARVEDCLKVITCKNHHTHDPLPDGEILAITGSTEVDKDLLPDPSILASDGAPANEGPLRPFTLLRLLSRNDSDRNFQVSIDKEKMKILQNGYEYYYQSSNSAHSLWKCIYSFIRRCRAVLYVDNQCKQGFLPKIPKHNHPVELWDIFRYPLGKNSIMDSNTKTMKPFWYLMQSDFLRSYPILIYDQNKFHMTFINEHGDSCKFRCAGQSGQYCTATLTVTMLFESIAATGSPHNHESPSEEKIATWIRIYGGGAADEEHEEDSECDNQIAFVEVPMDSDDTLKCDEL